MRILVNHLSVNGMTIALITIVFLLATGGCSKHSTRIANPSLTRRLPMKMPITQDKLCATVHDLVKKEDLPGINPFYLALRGTDCGESTGTVVPRDYLIGDDAVIRLIEESHKILFDDYLAGGVPKNIRVEFKDVHTETKHVGNQVYAWITSAQAINPNPGKQTDFWEFDKLIPGCPRKDRYHRYVEVPISYTYPEWGTFLLYYEVNSDFDDNKPVVMVPTDAQRDSSQIGMADKYKKMFGTSLNIVTYEYRGQFCSKISEFQTRGWDWRRAYFALNSDNAVEDIERIRKDLLGDKKMYLLGGSGISSLGLKYLAKYHHHIERAFLMSFFKDAVGGSYSAVAYLSDFLQKENLTDSFSRIVERHIVPLDQLLFIIQRMLYSDEGKAKQLIAQTSENDLNLFKEESEKLGSVDHFIRFYQKYWPQAVVFMYETNVPTSKSGEPDINAPFLRIAEPLHKLEEAGLVPSTRFDIADLERITTEVLLVAGTLDQVAPIKEMRKIRSLMPQSKLAIFEAYHCLMESPEMKKCRNGLDEVFFRYGMHSKEFANYLGADVCRGKFLSLE